ncbi:hypothetical protein [Salinibacter altiplanensis]|uniref:hypothetical protein n=1 Tax=Salinibacter altiplanensis TaxID=1803181 RepID=UPI000C9ECAC1|nr:hypothetical protein [Salinibacter altiplanensis]
MQRFLRQYTKILFLPLLAMGLVLAGCDSTGSNGPDDNPSDPATNAYPESGSYDAEIVSNLLTGDLRSKIDGAPDTPVDKATLTALYTGDINNKTIAVASGLTTEGQSTYDDIAGGVDLSTKLSSDVTTLLVGSAALASDDSPDPGNQVTTDDLVRFYFGDVASNDRFTTPNGVHMGQLSEKLLASALYGEAARILTDFVDDPSSVNNPAEKWDAAFGYYGAPRDFEESFLDLDNPEGLVDGSGSRDVDESGGVDLTTEFVYTWAGYTAERAAAAEANSPNNFAGRAFEGFREGRKAIEDGNLDELSGSNGFAAQARDAWEATVAVNVIHYMNGLEGDLAELGDTQTVEDGDLDENAWGEAKAFAWGLQFYSDKLSTSQLQTIHEKIGNAPPYGEKTASEYDGDLTEATEIIETAYGFNSTNVEEW